MISKLFSSQKKCIGSNNGQEKFELVSCPLNGKFCTNIRAKMNQNYQEYLDFRSTKEFDKSIDALGKVYNETMKLPESPCGNCVAFYQSTIVDSMEDVHDELKGMTKGLFSTKRFESSREKAEQALEELKNEDKKELKKAV